MYVTKLHLQTPRRKAFHATPRSCHGVLSMTTPQCPAPLGLVLAPRLAGESPPAPATPTSGRIQLCTKVRGCQAPKGSGGSQTPRARAPCGCIEGDKGLRCTELAWGPRPLCRFPRRSLRCCYHSNCCYRPLSTERQREVAGGLLDKETGRIGFTATRKTRWGVSSTDGGVYVTGSNVHTKRLGRVLLCHS